MDQVAVPGRKKTLYFVTWLVALLATGGINPVTALSLPLFPAGLAVAFDGASYGAFSVGAIVVGWILYLVHGVAILRTRSGTLFWVLYAVFVAALLVNMHGCQRDLTNAAHIH